jgi:hypothetical protein
LRSPRLLPLYAAPGAHGGEAGEEGAEGEMPVVLEALEKAAEVRAVLMALIGGFEDEIEETAFAPFVRNLAIEGIEDLIGKVPPVVIRKAVRPVKIAFEKVDLVLIPEISVPEVPQWHRWGKIADVEFVLPHEVEFVVPEIVEEEEDEEEEGVVDMDMPDLEGILEALLTVRVTQGRYGRRSQGRVLVSAAGEIKTREMHAGVVEPLRGGQAVKLAGRDWTRIIRPSPTLAEIGGGRRKVEPPPAITPVQI